MQIVTRAQAIALKRHRYYTGRPCRHGHDAERYTINANCVTCTIEAAANARLAIKHALSA